MTETIAEGARHGLARQALSTSGVIALLATAFIGGNAFGLREHFFGLDAVPRPVAVARAVDGPAPSTPAHPTSIRSQPWWQGVTTLHGDGAASPAPFSIGAGALQWRVRWTCDSGHLSVRAAPLARPLIDAACPGTGTGYATKPGLFGMDVEAAGPWTIQIDQQVDVPLDEAPSPAMTAPGATTVATGVFYGIDQTGTGRLELHRLADGSYAIRLADFYVTPNVDLTIKLSPLPAPHSTPAFTAAPSVLVAPLDITAGSMNFTVPRDVAPDKYLSVVIWCEQLNSAYAAASLVPR